MAGPLRYNDFSYGGPVHKWIKQPVPVGAVVPQGQLQLPKWVRTGACAGPGGPWRRRRAAEAGAAGQGRLPVGGAASPPGPSSDPTPGPSIPPAACPFRAIRRARAAAAWAPLPPMRAGEGADTAKGARAVGRRKQPRAPALAATLAPADRAPAPPRPSPHASQVGRDTDEQGKGEEGAAAASEPAAAAAVAAAAPAAGAPPPDASAAAADAALPVALTAPPTASQQPSVSAPYSLGATTDTDMEVMELTEGTAAAAASGGATTATGATGGGGAGGGGAGGGSEAAGGGTSMDVDGEAF
jgi:hypothetical protein